MTNGEFMAGFEFVWMMFLVFWTIVLQRHREDLDSRKAELDRAAHHLTQWEASLIAREPPAKGPPS
jgi:hypothetical protein